jgi:hypothetical protein
VRGVKRIPLTCVPAVGRAHNTNMKGVFDENRDANLDNL